MKLSLETLEARENPSPAGPEVLPDPLTPPEQPANPTPPIPQLPPIIVPRPIW